MSIAIHWFRQDLRLADNPALSAAARAGTVLPIYILDDVNAGQDKMGAASRVWLHHAINALNTDLGGRLAFFKGNAETILQELCQNLNIQELHWNRCYEPWRIARDQRIKSWAAESGIKARSYNGSLLWEPWEIKKNDGTPYRVFTPFFQKGCLAAPPPRHPINAPQMETMNVAHNGLDALELLPKIRWDEMVSSHWKIGEAAAHERLSEFLKYGLEGYAQGRNFPAQKNVSRLSADLHFGTLTPNQAWWAITSYDQNAERFRAELGWREFSYSLLHHLPKLRRQNWNPKFDTLEWREDPAALSAWQRGQTGIPIVDAGMRELWQTGYMHNRVRMIVASFLTKNLLIDWRLGEAWFWDTLFDADAANNPASWQWVAGCGADAAPYFRIFNPVLQSEKFDKSGTFIRQYVPELSSLPDKHIHAPWRAPKDVLRNAKVELGTVYPHPVVDLTQTRARAIAAFKALS